MRIWQTINQVFTLPDLRKKILYTISLMVITRVLAHIPLPGVDIEALRTFFSRNQIFGLLNMFSGGSMENFSIIMMGVGPYITATIIVQLLTMVIPSLEELRKEGESGQKKINYWTRIITVPLALIQSFSMLTLLKSQGILFSWTPLQLAVMLLSITAGTILLMWIGELISENGIGNGISLIIALGIIASVPAQVRNTLAVMDTTKIISLALFGLIAIAVVILIIIVNEGRRQIPVSYARRIRGMKSYGGVDSYLPIRVNTAGVIPIIFAMSIMIFPGVAAKVLTQARSEWLASASTWVANLFNNNLFYGIFYFILVILFTFFYTGIVLKPNQISENLQKQGGFIPGVRPGGETSSYLARIISRINLTGALFLGVIAVLPFIIQAITKINTLVIGGTGILIMVSVIIETMRQIQAQLLMRSYENY
ncbi:MAG: Protein translocase subunit SecY [Berkelbacteria bacterium GW2011_GWB1_38_5]|uniref:Protein translocase subunit SecY n=2 Tax=Candidatus Berkelbacteria TaxID=1618330 RepID=A0A0G0NYK8_9BACT|nr:MAG: Protein translocase subunit SecY [Berkelbacteria bacterium GW2011_GWB1_38_5]KKQ90959.1 MAG: Protein translocase subunit SecY [Berkelbacteria bacterium GW2011_GWA1_39_10]